eukprot:scaffold66096_cov63-Phaeocystis_antarctica.AAC.6
MLTTLTAVAGQPDSRAYGGTSLRSSSSAPSRLELVRGPSRLELVRGPSRRRRACSPARTIATCPRR